VNKKEVLDSGLVLNVENVPGSKVPGENERILKVLMSPHAGNYEKATVLISDISPRKSTGMHTHDSDEIMYVAAGEGTTECGGNVSKIKVGALIFAPKKIEHTVNNTGDKKLRLVCFYIPPIEPKGYFEEATQKTKEYLKSI